MVLKINLFFRVIRKRREGGREGLRGKMEKNKDGEGGRGGGEATIGCIVCVCMF